MKISLKWLSDYIDIKDYLSKPKDLAAILTAAGLEVESITDQGKQFASVVVGHILVKGQHPNADRLSLCQVSTGEGRVHQIVCGAQNHKQDDRVVVALPGAVLPGDFAIKLSKIRGVESAGMLCSEKELGLKVEAEGIMILPQDAPIGKSFAEYMGYDDIFFELKVTPNRADCLSHFGLARELATVLDRKCELPMESLMEDAHSTRDQVSLQVLKPDLCPRYAGRAVLGVKVGPSPEKLKKRLESIGVKSINNVVDITNYVMHELGQPMHAFDMRELKGGKIIVDTATKGEKFTTLDGTEKTFTGEELTIRDGERVVALAGVVGGKNSGISDSTENIFLESACFLSSSVRKTARALGIETDSSYRFSRGVNPEAVPLALNRAAIWIQKLAGGEITSNAYDNYPVQFERKPIFMSLQLITQRLGYAVSGEAFVGWMKRLGCDVSEGDQPHTWRILPPLFRMDLGMDMDLVEEFARLDGYQNIPESLPKLDYSPSVDVATYTFEKRLKKSLVEFGYHQAINYAFVSRTFQASVLGDESRLTAFGLRAVAEPVAIVNPLNEEINVMRASLIPPLLKNVSHNFNNGVATGQLFEMGFAHFKETGTEVKYGQEARVALVKWGSETGLWQKTQAAANVFELCSAVRSLFKKLQINKYSFDSDVGAVPSFLHPKQTVCVVVEGKPIGFIGTLHPNLTSELKIRTDVAFAELNVDKLSMGQPRVMKYTKVSRQPTVERDLSFKIPETLQAAQIETVIRTTGGPKLKDISVFDVFSGGNMEAGHRSVSFRLSFQDTEASLEDTFVNDLRDKIVAAVEQKFQVGLR